MDSLRIQDVFEPYYAGRGRFPAPAGGKAPADAGGGRPEARTPRPSAEGVRPSTESESATEH